MLERILTEKERQRVRNFMRTDGEITVFLSVLAFRCRKHLPQIKKDLELLEKFMETYEKSGKKLKKV